MYEKFWSMGVRLLEGVQTGGESKGARWISEDRVGSC